MKFKLTEKTYRKEKYESSSFQWKNKRIKFIVRMWYHTKLKYWDVAYELRYGKDFLWAIAIKSKGMLNKREAREFTKEYMREANYNDVEKLSSFYKKSIIAK